MKQYLKLTIIFILYFMSVRGQSINDLIPKGEAFFIQSAQEYGKRDMAYWDIPGGEDKIVKGAQIKVWGLGDQAKDRRYVIENSSTAGYVKIHIDGVAGYLDVKGGKNNNGQDLIIWDPGNGWNQNFTFKYLGNGRFKIYSQGGKVICLSGRKSDNGNAITIWDDHDGPWMEWCLISVKTRQALKLEDKINAAKTNTGADMNGIRTFYIQSALTYGKSLDGFFDVPGVSAPAGGNNIQLWGLTDRGSDRKYRINTANNNLSFYNICVADNPNLNVDIAGGVNTDGANIQLYEKNNSSAQDFIFKYMGNGKFKIINANGKVICTNGRESKNGTNVLVWTDHEGPWMEWYLIDTETNEPFIPNNEKKNNITDITSNDPGVLAAFKEIDNTYKSVVNVEQKSNSTLGKLNNTTTTMEKSYLLINKVSSLNSKVNDTQNALNPFSRLPIIGVPVKVITTSLGMTLGQLDKVDKSLQAIKDPVVGQANSNVVNAYTSNLLFNSKMKLLKNTLVDTKNDLVNGNYSGIEKTSKITKLSEKLNAINGTLSSVDGNFNKIDDICNKMKNIDKPVTEFEEGVNKFDNGMKPVDKVADEINDVLNKRFKKGIGKVKIDISVRDILEGGKVGKLFDKYVNKFLDGVLQPLLKKLNVKVPSVPGVDKFKDALNNTLDFTKKIKENSDKINEATNKLGEIGL